MDSDGKTDNAKINCRFVEATGSLLQDACMQGATRNHLNMKNSHKLEKTTNLCNTNSATNSSMRKNNNRKRTIRDTNTRHRQNV